MPSSRLCRSALRCDGPDPSKPVRQLAYAGCEGNQRRARMLKREMICIAPCLAGVQWRSAASISRSAPGVVCG